MSAIDRQNRSPAILVLPDQRKRVTRLADVLNNVPKTPAGILAAGLWLDWGTPDETFTDCRLVLQSISGQTGPFRKPVEEPPQLVRVYEEIPANARVIVGEPDVSFDQYGRKSVVIEYVQFSAGTAIYATVVGTTAAPSPFSDCILQHFESENDGTLITSKYTFIDAGILSDTEELKFGGKLKLRTIKGLNEIPATPAGYTLVTQGTEFVEGLPVYVRGFAAGGGGGGTGTGGIVSVDVRVTDSGNNSMDPAADDNVGVNITTIRYLTDLTQNTPLPETYGNSILIDVQKEDENGFRIWTTTWVNGNAQGSVVELEAKYFGTQGPGLRLYHRVGLGVEPDTPDATIGGAVTLTKSGVRQANGYVIYDYNWAEGIGTVDVTTRPRDDGSIEHNIITFSTDPELPAAPQTIGPFNYTKILAGTAVYCISLKCDNQDGYAVNTATWIEPPTNRSTESRTVTFTVPGLATAANPPTFVPPISRRLLATVFEYWGTSPNPNSDTPYTVTNWASLSENYTIADTGQQVSNIQALDGYVGNSTITGSNTTYRGIDVTTFVTTVGGSTPTAKPTGLTVLDLEWEPYLTDINGVIVWKTTAIKFTF